MWQVCGIINHNRKAKIKLEEQIRSKTSLKINQSRRWPEETHQNLNHQPLLLLRLYQSQEKQLEQEKRFCVNKLLLVGQFKINLKEGKERDKDKDNK